VRGATEPLTLLSPPRVDRWRFRAHRLFRGRRDRVHHASV